MTDLTPTDIKALREAIDRVRNCPPTGPPLWYPNTAVAIPSPLAERLLAAVEPERVWLDWPDSDGQWWMYLDEEEGRAETILRDHASEVYILGSIKCFPNKESLEKYTGCCVSFTKLLEQPPWQEKP